MMSNPDIIDSPLPEFLRNKVPMVKLGDWQSRTRYEPRYDDPAFQAAFRELVDLLAESHDGHADVEYVDTFMYGFWGEGHTWPLESNPFPDNVTAEKDRKSTRLNSSHGYISYAVFCLKKKNNKYKNKINTKYNLYITS